MPSDDNLNPDLESPFNKLPAVVVVLFLIMAGVEAVLALGEAGLVGGPSAIGWRLGLVRDWGFSGILFDAMWADGFFPLEHLARFLTYPFIHLSFTHALLAVVLMLALGKMAAEFMGQLAMLALFVLSGIGGALAYAFLLDDPVWLIGMLMALQLIWSLFGSVGNGWVAELAGFFCGFFLCFICAPGEWGRLLRRRRDR